MESWEQDLFEVVDTLPDEVQKIVNSIAIDPSYADLKVALEKIEKLGYTFDYYLDAVAFDLRLISSIN